MAGNVGEKYQTQVHRPLERYEPSQSTNECDDCLGSGFRREVAENCARLGYYAASNE
jgi:hypothetical protein